jgi:Uma2 family endonuclease
MGQRIHENAELLLRLMEQGVIPEARIEVFPDEIVMLSAARWEHSEIVGMIMAQLQDQGALILPGLDMVLPDFEPIPDVMVLERLPAPGQDATPDLVSFVVEVVSESNPENDYYKKLRYYALAGIPEYLIVDPRNGTCVKFTRPHGEEWRERAAFEFGEEIPTHAGVIKTSEFRRY